MTGFTTIPDADIDADSPITTALMTALRDNPKAIQEGDPSAPRIASDAFADNTLNGAKLGDYSIADSKLASRYTPADVGAGGVGSFAMMYINAGVSIPGNGTVAGSYLSYTWVGPSGTWQASTTASGTWRLMVSFSSSLSTDYRALFQRIA